MLRAVWSALSLLCLRLSAWAGPIALGHPPLLLAAARVVGDWFSGPSLYGWTALRRSRPPGRWHQKAGWKDVLPDRR